MTMENMMPFGDQHDFLKFEQVIEKGKQSFVEVGMALLQIRDRRLYRHKFETFEDYCQKRWGWTADYGRKLIAATSAVQGLTEKTKTKVSTAGAARALVSVPEKERSAVVEKAASTGKPVTAKSINAARSAIVEAEVILCDETGYKVPTELVILWQRGSEIQQLLTSITRVKSAVSNAQGDKDALYKEVNYSAVLADLTNAYNGLNRAKPYAVCPKCSGRTTISKSCLMCGGRGIVSKLMWDKLPPEQKKLRAAVVAKQNK